MSCKVTFSHIVAAARNHSIGYKGQLPWDLPEDMRFFVRKTKSHIMIMGRKTWESLPGLLPGRMHIVITRQKNYPPQAPSKPDLLRCVSDINKAMQLAEQLVHTSISPAWPSEVFIIGGAEIYKQSLNKVNKIYLTRIDKNFKGDTFYPELKDQFKLIEKINHTQPMPFSFETYISS